MFNRKWNSDFPMWRRHSEVQKQVDALGDEQCVCTRAKCNERCRLGLALQNRNHQKHQPYSPAFRGRHSRRSRLCIHSTSMEGACKLAPVLLPSTNQYPLPISANQVFCTTRPSIPDIVAPSTSSTELLYFDSLKTLPVGNASLVTAGHASSGLPITLPAASQPAAMPQAPAQAELDMDALQCIADYLRSCFKLTLFGFDVILGAVDQVLYVIDVNYFPHFKGIPSAAGHVRTALKVAHTAHLSSQAAAVHN